MRWPWQRGAPEARADEAPREPVTSATVEDRVPPSGWAFLPPLQRTIGSVRLTSDPEHFAGALSSWGDPSFTGPMAHLISAQAPPGVIDVDGGGPAPGNDGYTTAPMEMTLLPPPAPRVRPMPDRHSGAPETAQRVESDGGGSLLAAEAGSFQVLYVDALPLEPSASLPAELQSSDSSPRAGVSAPASGVDFSGPGRSRHTDGSTSDGSATYVPLPSAPAVQRAAAGPADFSPGFRQAPPMSKLGIGMPLSFSEAAFSEPASSEAGFSKPAAPAGPSAGTSPGSFPLPVQRASAPESSGSLRPLPAVDGGDRDADDAAVPDAGAGSANESSEGQTVPSTGSSDPSRPDPAPAMDAGVDEPVHAVAAWPAEARLSPPSEDRTAPLPSAVVPAARPEQPGRDGSAAESPSLSTHDGGTPNMSAVSRSGPDVTPLSDVAYSGDGPDVHGPELHGADVDGPDVAAAITEQPGIAGSLAAIATPTQTAHSDTGPARERPAVEATPSPPLVLGPASIGQSPPAANPQGSTPQHSTGVGSQSSSSPVASSRSSGESPGVGGPAFAPAALQLQRASRSLADVPARAIPKPVGPVVMRVVRTATAGTTPETWQRLTALPPAAARPPVPAREPPLAAVPLLLESASAPAAQAAYSDVTQVSPTAGTTAGIEGHAVPAPTSAPAPHPVIGGIDSILGGDFGFAAGFNTEAGAGTSAPFDGGPGAPPEPTAAVGRVIQRTISVQGAGPVDSADRVAGASSRSPVRMSNLPGTSAPQSAEPPSAGLQRWSASTASARGPALPAQVHAAAGSSLANAASPGFAAGPRVPAGTGSLSETPPPLILSLAAASSDPGKSDDVIQREDGFSAADFAAAARGPAAPGPSAPSSAMPKAADGGSSVQPGAEPAPPGPAPQGPAARGAAVPGGATAATPEQLEDLAKRLAGPLIRRIKAEMLLDRERRGLRTDAN
ncbi:hypothetical protein ACVWZ8_003863 [Arthrobacter sp. UYCu723]